jgi:hypothetical protein
LILIEKDLTVNRVNYCVTRWKDKKEKKKKRKVIAGVMHKQTHSQKNMFGISR